MCLTSEKKFWTGGNFKKIVREKVVSFLRKQQLFQREYLMHHIEIKPAFPEKVPHLHNHCSKTSGKPPSHICSSEAPLFCSVLDKKVHREIYDLVARQILQTKIYTLCKCSVFIQRIFKEVRLPIARVLSSSKACDLLNWAFLLRMT